MSLSCSVAVASKQAQARQVRRGWAQDFPGSLPGQLPSVSWADRDWVIRPSVLAPRKENLFVNIILAWFVGGRG